MSKLSSLAGRRVDLAVVGGGIIGAGVARDAAMRGLSVALFERADYGSGTTAGSTRLIHGGLRYLEQFAFPLVRLDLREREILLRNAPHLVKPLPFLLPFYNERWWARLRLRLGMQLYDALSFDKTLPSHRMLRAEQVASLEPHLAPRGLQGAALYYDAQAALPERLCLENILDASSHGAETFNYADVVGSLRRGSRVTGLRVRDVIEGSEVDVEARVVVNAAGPWLDRVARRLEPDTPVRLRTTQGIHVAVPPLTTHAVALRSAVDGRVVFVIPWLGYTWIGTTDTDYGDDPASAHAGAADVDYLLRSVRPYFPGLRPRDILFTNAGVRALVRAEGAASKVSRLHRIVDGDRTGAEGLITIVGSKLTGYRAIAEQATDLACQKLGVTRRAETAERPLPGAVDEELAAERSTVSDGDATHLEEVYGRRAARVLQLAVIDPSLRARLAPDYPDIAAQVVFAVREEQARRLSDVLLRRTRLGFTADQGRAAAERVADLMARELGWPERRRLDETRAYHNVITATQAFRAPHDRACAESAR
ncbi:MAG: FAD-dependent oxidoreductase [Luteitalea sp.]|nr:FAD-dependent oxidoreductase [Luteitalea sp.]